VHLLPDEGDELLDDPVEDDGDRGEDDHGHDHREDTDDRLAASADVAAPTEPGVAAAAPFDSAAEQAAARAGLRRLAERTRARVRSPDLVVEEGALALVGERHRPVLLAFADRSAVTQECPAFHADPR